MRGSVKLLPFACENRRLTESVNDIDGTICHYFGTADNTQMPGLTSYFLGYRGLRWLLTAQLPLEAI